MAIILNRIKRILAALLNGIRTLRWKLFISYILIAILPLLFFGNVISTRLENFFVETKSKELRYEANKISDVINSRDYLYDNSARLYYNNDIILKSTELKARIIVTDKMAYVFNDSYDAVIGQIYAIPEIMEALSNNPNTYVSPDKTIVHETVPIVNDYKEVIGAVMISYQMTDSAAVLSSIDSQSLLLTLLLSAIVTILVFFISQLLLDPLKNILSAVKNISEGHLDQRVSLTGHDEFSELSIAFNDMTSKLEQVETTRQEFVSNVSHELKTPLSSIKVLSESLLLQEDVPNETYKEFLMDITSEVDRMADIINELLALVRLEQTENPLNVTHFSVNRMIDDIFKRLSPLAEQKEIGLSFEEIRPVNVEGDEMKLSLAISNLVENAIKYTDEGGSVKVIVDCDHQHAFITVQDNGVGISEENQGKVFTRFYRVDKTRDRQTGGTGLGLAITHKTILMHKGSIKLISKENEGSSFIVRIPLHFNNQ